MRESLRRGYILAKNTIMPPRAKSAALELGKVLSQRQHFKDNMARVLKNLKKHQSQSYPDIIELEALQDSAKKFKHAGRRVYTGQSGKIFTPVAPDLLEPRILKPDVSDPRNPEEVFERYRDVISYPGRWEQTPDGEYYARVFDIADDVREAVARIAKEFGVHFTSNHGTFGSEGHFLDRFTPPAHLNDGEFGCGGYCGHASVSFADDRQVLIDAFKYFAHSLEDDETDKD